jgi:hypothetical protein
MSNNQQPQDSDSKGQGKAPLLTLEPKWEPTPFPFHQNVPNTAASTAPMPVPTYPSDVVPGGSGFRNVEGPPFPPMAPAAQQVNGPAMSSETGEAIPVQSDIVNSTKCPSCGAEFIYLYEVDRHVAENHPHYRWPCPICNCKEEMYTTRGDAKTTHQRPFKRFPAVLLPFREL